MVLLQFKHLLNGHLLQFDTVNYQNHLGQTFSVSKFKYYVGKICLKSANGKDYTSDEYFLIDEEDDLSKAIELRNVPPGEYNEISFTLGIDSVYNCSGAQSGALDPLNGMFWSWNTGYIFLKLEGYSKQCNTPSNIFEYHIGGYKGENNCIRKIKLPLEKSLVVSVDAKPVVQINASVDEVLKNPKDIDFAKLPTVTDHNHATLVADNYADIFSVASVRYAK